MTSFSGLFSPSEEKDTKADSLPEKMSEAKTEAKELIPEEEGLTEDTEVVLVSAEITDSYPLKVFFDMIKLVRMKKVQICFDAEGIRFLAHDGGESPESAPPQTYEAIVPKIQLIGYVFLLADPLIHTFQLEEIGGKLCSLRKKTSVLFLVKSSNPDHLIIDPDPYNPHSSGRKGFDSQVASDMIGIRYDIPDDKPCIVVPSDSFSNKFRPVSGASRSAKNTFDCFDTQIRLSLAGQISYLGSGSESGSDEKKLPEPKVKIEVNREVPKALVKLTSMAPHSAIQGYWDAEGSPLKFSGCLGYLGRINIYYSNPPK